ncbi:UvrD-helicase domain-containing protein [Mycolicibacterium gadium]|uniref:ATP-dependent helicase n=1 Tax=Mycolicibacterium gadium TaxID=1794 RepID=A0ABT6GKT2_MYCGU|nr:ATP-dependent helicase [Mycolicibacterium gadium]MDG5481988.1 ATP-dependent helicase [Mycolicibacterium gadium]
MTLSDQQKLVVNAEGNFLLLACPGSGKTRSAAARAANLIRASGPKVAVCSYTNVGANRIRSVLETEIRMVLPNQHFCGTIHKFLLRYVVGPFAHLLGAQRGPHILEGATWPQVRVHGDNAQRIGIDCFRRSADGGLIVTNQPRTVRGTSDSIVASVGDDVLKHKGAIFRRSGFLTADDAMWVALRVLREHPEIAVAAAARFDEILLDEAQDTSELQLACLDALHATQNLSSLVLVGDVEQSIYSFQGASAARCQALARDRGLSTLNLTENHRSSQNLCDIAVNFCNRAHPDKAVGANADCTISPEVVLYPAANPALAMDIYRERLAEHGIATADAVVLARNWTVVEELNGQRTLFGPTDRQYIVGKLAAHLAAGTLTAHDVRTAQRLLAYCAWDDTTIASFDEERRRELRDAAYSLLKLLPPLEGDLRSWLVTARSAVQDVAVTLTAQVKHTAGRAITAAPTYANYQALDVFSPSCDDLQARTVHSFKGEDSDAVMVVIRRPYANDPTSQMELWEAAVAGTDVDPAQEEERRVLFVALTRAKRYCLVALPNNQRGRAVLEACDALGFQPVRTN